MHGTNMVHERTKAYGQVVFLASCVNLLPAIKLGKLINGMTLVQKKRFPLDHTLPRKIQILPSSDASFESHKNT